MTAPAPPLPSKIQLEVTGACNLRCAMCLVAYRPLLNRAEGAMSFALFRRIVDALPDLRQITLQGLGEPLLAPDLFEMIGYATRHGIRMGFNTNGTLLTQDRARRLVEAGLDWLHVSLDGATAETYESIRAGSSFERVEAGVHALVQAMGPDATRPTTSLVFVAMRRNVAELPALVRLSYSWGLPRIRVQNLSHSFSDTDPAGSYAEIRRFAADEALWQHADPDAESAFAEARAEADRLGVELRLPRTEERLTERRAEGTPGCTWPWDSMYVTHDGLVQPCCMVMGSDRVSLGDLTTEDLRTVWEGPAYGSFREALMSRQPPEVCRGCSMYRGVF